MTGQLLVVVKRATLYVLIAIGFLALVAAYLAVSVYTGHREGVPVGWLGLVGFTPLVFWAVIKSFRRYWKYRGFWFAVIVLLILHLATFASVLCYYPQWPLMWFVPTSFVEAGLFVTVISKFFDNKQL